jgi:hypothetical protein
MPRPGLRLTRAQEEELREELQISRGQKDLKSAEVIKEFKAV